MSRSVCKALTLPVKVIAYYCCLCLLLFPAVFAQSQDTYETPSETSREFVLQQQRPLIDFGVHVPDMAAQTGYRAVSYFVNWVRAVSTSTRRT